MRTEKMPRLKIALCNLNFLEMLGGGIKKIHFTNCVKGINVTN